MMTYCCHSVTLFLELKLKGMEDTAQNRNLVAFCGLYCGNCNKFKKSSCPGCMENAKAGWCKIRLCCMEKKILSCAECDEYVKPGECARYNNVFSKVIQFVTHTDRELCIDMIKKEGREFFISHMKDYGRMSLPKSKN
jgi:hypothetical protein